MATQFVRKITGTKCRGEKTEPLYTNTQNDLLNDVEDVFIRNKDEYHALTDNLKTEEFKVGQFLSISNKTKNGLTVSGIKATQVESENGTDVQKIMNPLRTKQAIDVQVPIIVNEITEPKFDALDQKIDKHVEDFEDYKETVYSKAEVDQLLLNLKNEYDQTIQTLTERIEALEEVEENE